MEKKTQLQIPSLTAMNCQKHNRMIQCLNLSNTNPLFMCLRCLLSNSQKSLEIQEIQDCSDSHVFEGWPFKDEEFSKKLARILNNESTDQDQLQEQEHDQNQFIESSIIQIQKEIIVVIQNLKSAFTLQANVINKSKAAIMSKYNNFSKKAQLKELLSDISNDQLVAIEPSLRSILSEANQDADKNQEILQNQIEQHERKLKELSIASMKKVLKTAILEWVQKTAFLQDDNHEKDCNIQNTNTLLPQRAIEESKIQETLNKQLESAQIELKERDTQIKKQADLISNQSKQIKQYEGEIKESNISQSKLSDQLKSLKNTIFEKESKIIELNLMGKETNADFPKKKEIQLNQLQNNEKITCSDELQQLQTDYSEIIKQLMIEESNLNNQLLESKEIINQLQEYCSKLEIKITETNKPKGCGKKSSYNLTCNNQSCQAMNEIYRVLDSIGNKGGKHCGDECFECRENDRKGVFRCASDQNKKKVICPYQNDSRIGWSSIPENGYKKVQTQKGEIKQSNETKKTTGSQSK